MTLGEFISRLFFYIFRIISHYFKRKYDFLVSTYLKEEPDGVLFSYIRNISISSDDFPIEVIRDVTSNYIDHNFDLLGSGWVNVSYGNKYSGLDGHKFDSNFIKFNIKNRINHSNVNSSLKIWSLVDEGYSPIDWQIDFKSGYRWSEKTWSHDVPVGHLLGVDIKVPWELARLQHLPQIALAYVLSKSNPNKLFDSDVYLSEFTNVVLDFIANNPPRFGVNWRSTMDVGIRAVNILLAYDILRNANANFNFAFEKILLKSMYEHGYFIVNNLERRHFPRGNHYLSHIVSLLFISSYLPSNQLTENWLAFSIKELLDESKSQFNDDGSNFEGSTSYHRLSSEMLVYATALVLGLPECKRIELNSYQWSFIDKVYEIILNKERNEVLIACNDGYRFPEWYVDRIANLVSFVIDYTKPTGSVVQIGDNDSGRFVKLFPIFSFLSTENVHAKYQNIIEVSSKVPWWDEDILNHKQLVSSASGLFYGGVFIDYEEIGFEKKFIESLCNRNQFKYEYVHPEYRHAKPNYESIVNEITSNSHCYRYFVDYSLDDVLSDLKIFSYPKFGLYGYKSSRFFLSIRCGAVGQNGHGGHSHNDQLSVELEIDGKGFFVDPGSNLYTSLPNVRNLYRSDRAHFSFISSLTESADISKELFKIGNDPKGVCLLFDDNCFIGVHEGFGVKVLRKVIISVDGIEFIDHVSRGNGSDSIRPFYEVLSSRPDVLKTVGYGKVIR